MDANQLGYYIGYVVGISLSIAAPIFVITGIIFLITGKFKRKNKNIENNTNIDINKNI